MGQITHIVKFLDFRGTFAAMRLSRTFLMSADSRLKSWWSASEKSKDPVARFYDFCMGVGYRESPVLHMVKIGCFSSIACELLPFACKKGYAKLVGKLVEGTGRLSDDFSSALMTIACKVGSLDIVRFFYKRASLGMQYIHLKDWVHFACRLDHAAVMDYFIQVGACDVATSEELLHTASTNGCTRVVHRLLKDPSVRASSKENRALLAACEGGHSSIAKMLISHGTFAPVNMERCLREALRTSDEIVESIMFCEGIAFDFDLAPVMRWACKRSNLEVARLVAEADSSERMVEAYLTMACSAGCVPIAKLLMDRYEADPSKGNSRAMICACKSGSASMVELLLRDGRADPSCNNSEAIITAAVLGHLRVVGLLMSDDRVDPSAKRNLAVKVARQSGHVEVVNLLMTHQAVRSTFQFTS